ncbi:SAM-dependent methyltransferase [Bailinhaonella thermotolerans]|uniref:SAM-dependent methyltransferase n=2 Tax=Bailinhaonella thermotolerans TaxID=1070861 RepID=A0A3A4B532_9ACTN|nr:SAM-dependent methyltransferase [Bailinhaonella thermotolerans]
MYDYYLGGKDNFASDRAGAAKILEIAPNVPELARANRAFLGRAVRYLAAAGIRQFLDIGAGLPTQENVHQVARRAAPDSRVVYVDNDPIVLVHARALLQDDDRTGVVQGDMHEPEKILADPGVRALLDFSEPVAVLLLAVLHFVPDDAQARRIVEGFRAPLVPGSHLVISHATSGTMSEDDVREGAEVYRPVTAGSLDLRTPDRIEALFGGLELLPPGVVPLADWRPDPGDAPQPVHPGAGAVCGVARVP